jgi:hypothetical protein
LIDRFRSLPMWGPAVVAGRILADVGTNVIQLVVMFAVGIAAGFRFHASFLEVVTGIALLLLLGYAFSWVFAFIGLTASSPEAANAYGFTILFPVTFVSSAFVPPETMPGWLQPVAEYEKVGVGLRAELVQEFRRALDVSEEKGDGPGREVGAHGYSIAERAGPVRRTLYARRRCERTPVVGASTRVAVGSSSARRARSAV